MNYVFTYQTLVNREYNIYKEIIFNPFLFSFMGIKDPKEVKDVITYTKNKSSDILYNVIDGEKIKLYDLMIIYKVLLDNNFFENEAFNLYSNYVDELLLSSKVDEVTILVNDIDPKIEDMIVQNIIKRFSNNPKLKIIKTKSSLVSEDIKKIDWDCISVRDVEQVIDIIDNNKIKGKDIILEENGFNKLDPAYYIILQEKDGRIDYRSMI